jgi:hypothetical protein
MTQGKKIRVRAYSGHRTEERPICFWLDEKQMAIRKILWRWYEQGTEVGGGTKSCFQVEGEDGQVYQLCYHHTEFTWFLRRTPGYAWAQRNSLDRNEPQK